MNLLTRYTVIMFVLVAGVAGAFAFTFSALLRQSLENLNIESIYTLGTGLVIMFEKLALRHG